MSSPLVEHTFLTAAVVVASVAAVTDARTGRIPNWLTLGTLASAPVAHVVVALAGGESARAASMRGALSLLGMLVAVVPLFLFRKGALGGGDVKLFAALGAVAGFEIGLDIVFHSFVVGAVLAVAALLYRGRLLFLLRNLGVFFRNAFRPAEKKVAVAGETMSWFRMGPAIFVAAALELALRWHAA